MRWFSLVVLSIVAALSARAEPQQWEGAVELPGGAKLGFSVKLDGDKGTISIPDQGVKDLPLSDVSTSDKEIRFTLIPGGTKDERAHAKWALTPDANGNTASGVLRQMGGEFKTTVRRLADGEKPKGNQKPQDPKEPFPYQSIDVTIDVVKHVDAGGKVTGGVSLAGTLSIPTGKGPHPAVVLVSGSGPQNRDEELLGHRPFAVLADHLTRHGIAVLRYDDRGVGKSTGSFASATTEDFADDAAAALAFLRTSAQVDVARCGIIGHSEGGLIGPMLAARFASTPEKGPNFLVLLAGPGMDSTSLLVLQSKLIAVAAGVSEPDADRNAKAAGEVFAMIRANVSKDEFKAKASEMITAEAAIDPELRGKAGDELKKLVDVRVEQQWAQLSSPWFRWFLAADPAGYLAKIKVPVLAINGGKDLQVPPKENLAIIERTLKDNGNTQFTIMELPGLNHLFQTCTTGSPSEYASIQETFAPAALGVISDWIRGKNGPAPAVPGG